MLVTHQLQYLPAADEVVVLREGRVAERGTYRRLVAKGVDFHQFDAQQVGSTVRVYVCACIWNGNGIAGVCSVCRLGMVGCWSEGRQELRMLCRRGWRSLQGALVLRWPMQKGEAAEEEEAASPGSKDDSAGRNNGWGRGRV